MTTNKQQHTNNTQQPRSTMIQISFTSKSQVIKIINRSLSSTTIKHNAKIKKKRPMVHLSSAPNVKFSGKQIGSTHPVIPHDITPQRTVDIASKSMPEYATNGIVTVPSDDLANDGIDLNIHNEETVEKMRKASNLAARMLQLACQMAQPSITTNEIDEVVHNEIIKEGGYPSPLNYKGFPKSICCSINEVACHGIPDLRPLQDGDLISIDVSVYLDGFHGDTCASIIVAGDNNAQEHFHCSDSSTNQKLRAQALIDGTKDALYSAISICKAGTSLHEIGSCIHDVADSHRLRPMKKICGHGIGSQLHMYPEIKQYRNTSKSDTIQVLEPGMIITIEPVLVEGHHAFAKWDDGWTICTVDGGLAAQFEHTILITNEEPEILTFL